MIDNEKLKRQCDILKTITPNASDEVVKKVCKACGYTRNICVEEQKEHLRKEELEKAHAVIQKYKEEDELEAAKNRVRLETVPIPFFPYYKLITKSKKKGKKK